MEKCLLPKSKTSIRQARSKRKGLAENKDFMKLQKKKWNLKERKNFGQDLRMTSVFRELGFGNDE